jgi:hypothetical protein
MEVKIMEKEKIKCVCGNYSMLIHKAKLGRIKDKIITVFTVPIYCCSECLDCVMEGSDCLKFAKVVDKAYKLNLDEINFYN